MSFKNKMLLISLSWVGLLSVCLFVAFFSQKVQKDAQDRFEHSKTVAQTFNNILNVMLNLETGIRGYLLGGEDAYLEPFNQNEAKFNQSIQAAKILLAGDQEQLKNLEIIVDYEAKWINGPAVEEMMARRKLQRQMITMDQFIEAFKASKGKSYSDGVRQQVQVALDLEAKRMIDLSRYNEKATRDLKLILFGAIPVCTFFGLLLMLISVFKVNSTIQNLLQSFSKTVENLGDNSTSLSDLSKNLTESSKDVSDSTQKTASATLQINEMTSKNVGLTAESLDCVKRCLETSEKGAEVVDSVRTSIENVAQASDQIHTVILENNQKINTITEMMNNIKNKTNVINDIVFQTKLLSFNASVEAARAGENGKGFAVVAEEVGNLANMSGRAAKEISSLLESSAQEVSSIAKETVESMDRLYSEIRVKIKSSTEMSAKSSEIISTMKNDVVSVESITNQIAQASQEQATGIDEVNHSIQKIDKVTSGLTERSIECSAVSEDLHKFSDLLNNQIETLGQIFGRKNRDRKAG